MRFPNIRPAGLIGLLTIIATSAAHAQAPTFGPETQFQVCVEASEVLTADLDSDGDREVIYASNDASGVGVAVRENQPGGAFGAEMDIIPNTTSTWNIYAEDMDNDGDPDVLASHVLAHSLSWAENLGNMNFAAPDTITTQASRPYSAGIGDVDGDTDIDVVSGSTMDDFVGLHLNTGGMTFAPQDTVSTFTQVPRDIKLVDLDNDADLDILTVSLVTNQVVWFANLGGGNFAAANTLPWSITQPSTLLPFDADTDGDMDLILGTRASNTPIFYLENVGGGMFAAPDTISPLVARPTELRLEDMDNDGDQDILFAIDFPNQIGYIENTGGGTFGAFNSIPTNAAPQGVAAADMDDDGDLDLLSAFFTTDEVVWYENQGVCPGYDVDVNVIDASCYGAEDGEGYFNSGSPTSGSAPYIYDWSNGATTPYAKDLPAGTYTVIIEDVNSCVDTDTFTVAQPPELVANAAITEAVLCHGDSTGAIAGDATGGTMPYSRVWSTGSAADTLEQAGAGDYWVIVTDANACADTDSITLAEPAALVASAAITEAVLCHGDSTGAIAGDAIGGTMPHTLAWSTGTPADTLTGMAAGDYWVTVTDANACADTDSIALTEPTALSLSSQTTADTAGQSIGTASASAAGGTPPYSYDWQTGATDSAVNGLAAGDYSVTVADANGCTIADTLTIDNITGRPATSGEPGLRLFPNPTTGLVRLRGVPDGEPIHLSVRDLSGRLVLHERLLRPVFRLEAPAGVYLVEIRHAGRLARRKLVLN
jgi:hypothetical protein